MFPQKTNQAHVALQSHAGPLNLRERRLLILCDGKRGIGELIALYGADASALVQRLCEQGFLRMAAGMEPVRRDASVPATTASVHMRPPPTPVAVSAATAPSVASAAANPRRSLVAAKMYMLGMLELQRSEDALAHRMHLQTSREPGEIVAHLLASLRFLQERTNPSMAQRVRDRLGEALPEEYLPALAAASAAAA